MASNATRRRRLVTSSAALLVVMLLMLQSLSSNPAAMPAMDVTPTAFAYLPFVARSPTCPRTSPNQYTSGTAYQYDLDDPVRPAYNHADKNIELRGYVLTTHASPQLIDLGVDDQNAPKLDTLFQPARVPPLATLYRVRDWDWATSPDPGTRGDPIAEPPVTALGLQVTPGETLYVPDSGYDIGGGMEVIVLFADEDTVALRYAREDSVGGPPRDYVPGGPGYVVHVDGICTDPNLLQLYQSLDRSGGPRYVYVPPDQRPYTYPLPNLPSDQPIGSALSSEIVVAVVDTGVFQDPRSMREFWETAAAEAAEPTYPSDNDYANQWALERVNAPQAWAISQGQDSVIAILDTGVDLDHPDLEAKILTDIDKDFVNGDLSADDDHGHGTHVAGIAAATTDNGTGIAGLGWQAEILPLKVLGYDGEGTVEDIAEAISYAADSGADVINLSLGSNSAAPCPAILQTAIDYAHSQGVTVVAAAGNVPSTTSPEVFPANCDHVLGIGATTDEDTLADAYSNCGTHVSAAAPGGDAACPTCRIYSTMLGGAYGWLHGTSMSTPHVAGLAALLRARYPAYTPGQIASAILDNAEDLGPAGWDACYGCGRIDAYRSLAIGARGPEPLCFEGTLSPAGEGKASHEDSEAPFVPGEILVQLMPGTAARSILHPYGSSARGLTLSRVWRISVPAGQERAVLTSLRNNPDVQHADLNYLVFAQ